MKGLTVRWSLVGAPTGTEDRLRNYVAEVSHERFTGLRGMGFKTWRMREGEWFEGLYVFASDADRADFQATFTAGAEDAPGSAMIGSPPVLIEPCELVAVAEGGAGFAATVRGED